MVTVFGGVHIPAHSSANAENHCPVANDNRGERIRIACAEIPTEKFDSFRRVSFDPKRFPRSIVSDHSPDLAIAVGLAIRSVEE